MPSTAPFRILPMCDTYEEIKVHFVIADPYDEGTLKGDWIGLALSAVKVIKVVVLWKFEAVIAGLLSVSPWFYFFACATLLQFKKVSRGSDVDAGRVDIITGELPTAQRRGGDRKLLLGVPQDVRHRLLWRIIWTVGGIVSAASLTASYIVLGAQKPVVVYIWAGFQFSGFCSDHCFSI